MKFKVNRFMNEDVHSMIFWILKFIKITQTFIIKTRIEASVLTIILKNHANSKNHG